MLVEPRTAYPISDAPRSSLVGPVGVTASAPDPMQAGSSEPAITAGRMSQTLA